MVPVIILCLGGCIAMFVSISMLVELNKHSKTCEVSDLLDEVNQYLVHMANHTCTMIDKRHQTRMYNIGDTFRCKGDMNWCYSVEPEFSDWWLRFGIGFGFFAFFSIVLCCWCKCTREEGREEHN